jgi:hypothetical protein
VDLVNLKANEKKIVKKYIPWSVEEWNWNNIRKG